MISGAICTNYAGGKTCYVYGASDNSDREVMPNYLMQWEMIRWAVETGCTVYDFQGVSGILDPDSHMYGLYRFKSGFRGSLDELAGEFDCIYSPQPQKAHRYRPGPPGLAAAAPAPVNRPGHRKPKTTTPCRTGFSGEAGGGFFVAAGVRSCSSRRRPAVPGRR